MTETITYQELARRLDALKLFNKAPELDENIYDGLENGSLYETEPGYEDEPKEIYQWYLISPSDADYLKRNTDELIFYSDVLDEYVWGVTHYGTSWESVELEFGKDEPEHDYAHCASCDAVIDLDTDTFYTDDNNTYCENDKPEAN